MIPVEEFLLILFQFEEEGGVGGSDGVDEEGVGVIFPGRNGLSVDEVEIVEVGDVLEGLADGALELR